MNKSILIFGSAGFVGSNLIRYLSYRHKDYTIYGVDRLNEISSIYNVYVNRSHNFYLADVSDNRIVSRIVEIVKPTHIIYLANTHLDVKTNIVGLDNVLFCARKNESIIYCSSNTVYGNNTSSLLTEKTVTNPQDKFSALKLAAETLIKVHSPNTYIIRAPTGGLFGPRQIENGIVSYIINCLLLNKTCYLDDKRQARDLLCVSDLCSAIELAIEGTIDSGIYNVAVNNDYANEELYSMISDFLGAKKQEEKQEKYYSEKLYLDSYVFNKMNTEKIRSFGWKPEYSIKDRLRFTASWYQNNPWIFKQSSC